MTPTREQVLAATKEILSVFMEFKFLQEDWHVKRALEKYKQALEKHRRSKT